MSRRDPQSARVLGLWTAGWLAVFLLAGMFWLGEPSVQWPVLAVPLLWAVAALRHRRRDAGADRDGAGRDDRGWDDDGLHRRPAGRWGDEGDGAAGPRRSPRTGLPPAERTDTVERPALRRPSDDDGRGRRPRY